MARYRVTYIDWSDSEVDRPAEWLEWIEAKLADIDGEFRVARCLSRADLERHAATSEILVLGGSRYLLAGDNLTVLPRCVAIVKMGAGVDNIDIPAATNRGIVVVNTPQGVTDTVSDHAIALLFAIVRRVTEQDLLVRRGVWDAHAARPGRHFRQATLGLVGFGRIPQTVVRELAGFEMNVLACDPYVSTEIARELGVNLVALDELFASSDFISIHCALTPETRHLIDERRLRQMKRDAILVNTSRGPVVDEQALYRALTEGWIAGAAVDVLEQEPPSPDNPLLSVRNLIITPHLAAVSDLFPGALWQAVYQSIGDLFDHRWPESVVNRRDVQPRWELR